MSDDRSVGTIAVVDSGRPSPQRIAAATHKVAQEMGKHIPVVKIHGENDMNKMALILATLEANGINTVPPPPVRQAKQKPPTEVQERLKSDAHAKRERKRQKRLQQNN